MAYGNIVDYEEGPAPGAYNFKRADGSTMTFVGPAAEDLKQKLDAANKLMPKTANWGGNGPHVAGDWGSGQAPPPSVSDVGPNMSVAPPEQNMSVAPEQNASVGAPAGGGGWGGGDIKPQNQAPAGGGQPGMVNVGYGLQVGPDGQVYTYDPGSRGSKGGMMERSRTVSGGFDPNQEYVEGKEGAYLAERAAISTQMEAAKEQAAYEQTLVAERTKQMRDREIEAANQKKQIDEGVMKLEQRYELARKEYSGAKVDPQKALRGGRNWIYGLSAGLGAIGAGILKTDNAAVRIIEARIADNIAAQEAEIAVKKDTANNALSDLTRKLGSQELAKKALEGIQAEQFALEMRRRALSTSDKELEAKAMQMAAAAESKQLDFREQYRQAAGGMVTKSIVNVPGSAGRAPGLRPLSPEQQLNLAGKLKGLNAPAEGQGGAAQKKPAEQVRYEQSLEASSRTLEDFVAAHGGKYNPDTGEIEGELDLPVDLPGADTSATSGAKSRLVTLGSVYANMINSGAEAGQPTKEAVTPQLGVTGSPRGQLEAMGREIAQRRQQQGLVQ